MKKNDIVLAFEPDSVAYKILQINVIGSKLRSVKLFMMALDYKDSDHTLIGTFIWKKC